MKRAAVVLFLLACVAGVILLLLETSSDRTDRRDVAPGGIGASTGTSAGGGTSAGDARNGPSEDRPALDDDPNRIPGPDVTLRGRVLFNDLGVADAEVSALRAYPWNEPVNYRWAWRDHERTQPVIATTRSEDGGRFVLTVPRRRRLILRAARAGAGPATLLLLIPHKGDPKEVVFHLVDGQSLEGIVVNEADKPVAAAEVSLSDNDYQRPPVFTTATTDEAGRFAFRDLAERSYRLRVTSEDYPPVNAYANLPSQRQIRIRLKRGGDVFGIVMDHRSKPLPEARIMMSTRGIDGYGAADVTADGAGAYRVSVFPGSINSVTVEHPSCGTVSSARQQIILPTGLVASGGELRFDIKLKPGVPVNGRAVMRETGAPVPGASITLLQMGTNWRGLNAIGYAKADDDGRFVFPYVTKGSYALEALAPGAARRAVRYGQAQTPITIDFFVDGESTPKEQRVELDPAGTVQGEILGVEPQGDRYQRPGVNLQTPSGNISATVDDVGLFRMDHVPPMKDAVVSSYRPQAKSDPFEVKAGEVVEVTLDSAADGGYTGVVEDEMGKPLAGARVSLTAESQMKQNLQNTMRYGGGWGSARTGADGRFHIAIPEWIYQYWSNQKFVLATYHHARVPTLTTGLDLPKKGQTKEVRIVVGAGGTITGIVEFQGGGPAAGLYVSLSPVKDKDAPFETRVPLNAYTRFDGRFEFRGVADGLYRLSASHHSGKAEPLDARAGDKDVRVVIAPTTFIAGVVVTEDGLPVSGAQVSAMVPSPKGETKRSTNTGQNGRFRIWHLDEGTYPVEVSPQKRNYGATAAGFETKRVEGVATGTENLVIEVSEGPTLLGRVLDPAGKPVAGAGVIAMALETQQPKQPSQPRRRNQVMRPSAVTNGRGGFELKGIGLEEVELLVIAQGFQPKTQRAIAGQDEITIRVQRGAVIEGRILKPDGTPLAGQWLWLNPKSPEVRKQNEDWRQRAGQTFNYLGGWYVNQGRTDSDGNFSLTSLPEGEYQLNLSLTDGVLPPTTLRTGEGSVTLRLQKPYTIKGRVTDEQGNPIEVEGNNRVWINAQAGGQWVRGTSADEDGFFELKGVPPGTVTLQVWARGYQQAKVDAEAGAEGVLITMKRVPTTPPKK